MVQSQCELEIFFFVIIFICVWHFDFIYIVWGSFDPLNTITLPKHVTWSSTYVLCSICWFDCLFVCLLCAMAMTCYANHHNSIDVIHFVFIFFFTSCATRNQLATTTATATLRINFKYKVFRSIFPGERCAHTYKLLHEAIYSFNKIKILQSIHQRTQSLWCVCVCGFHLSLSLSSYYFISNKSSSSSSSPPLWGYFFLIAASVQHKYEWVSVECVCVCVWRIAWHWSHRWAELKWDFL